MIRYSKAFWGYLTLLKWHGSAVPRALPFSLFAAALAGILEGLADDNVNDSWIHPYPYQTFAFVAGFIIVFRTNLSYGRYWEGRTQMQLMSSKLTDAMVQATFFDRVMMPSDATPEMMHEHEVFVDNFMHLCSLLHAVALATLRDDYNMDNLSIHDSRHVAPADNLRNAEEDAREILGDSSFETSEASKSTEGDCNEDVRGADARGGGAADARSRVSLSAKSAKSPSAAEEHGAHVNMKKQSARRVSLVESSKEQSGLRNFLDLFVLRTGRARAAQINTRMTLPVIGGLTQAEGIALGAFATNGVDQAVPDLNTAVHGHMLDDDMLAGRYLPSPTERVHTVTAWIHQCLLQRIKAGGVAVAAPIQSRIHHVLSDTMLGYEQARKLVDTPFPFPWAQVVTIVLCIFTVTAPFVIAAHTNNVPTAMVVAFIAVHTYIMLNEVARDIEDPFCYDPNELPLPQYQFRLNERLLACSRTTRPVAFTDFASLQGPGNRPRVPEPGEAEVLVEQSGDMRSQVSAAPSRLVSQAPGPFLPAPSAPAATVGPAESALDLGLQPYSSKDDTNVALSQVANLRWRHNNPHRRVHLIPSRPSSAQSVPMPHGSHTSLQPVTASAPAGAAVSHRMSTRDGDVALHFPDDAHRQPRAQGRASSSSPHRRHVLDPVGEGSLLSEAAPAVASPTARPTPFNGSMA